MPTTPISPTRYNPWRSAYDINVRIIIRSLPIELLGFWDQPTRTVVLDTRLTDVEQRCVLAYQLVLAERGDCGPCSDEEVVQGLAARRLITVEDLALACLLHADELGRAAELFVDVDTLRTRVAGLTAQERAFVERRAPAVRRLRLVSD